MPECDICATQIARPNGCLLTTKQVVSNPAYWNYLFSHQAAHIVSMPNAEIVKGEIAKNMANQSTPWLVCNDCAAMLGEDLNRSADYAKKWWESGGNFSPPGSGAVPVGTVQFYRLPDSVSRSSIPRPSQVYIFGRTFRPSEDQVHRAISALCHMFEGRLTYDHFVGLPVTIENESAANRELFFTVIDRTKIQFPKAYARGAMYLDQVKGQEDMAIVAIWEGPDAELAKSHLENPEIAAITYSHPSTTGQQHQPSVGEKSPATKDSSHSRKKEKWWVFWKK